MCFLEVPEENNRRGAQRWRGLGAARAGESGPRNERTGCRSCGSGGGVPLVPAKPKNHNTLSLSVAVNLDEKQNRRERKKTNPSHTPLIRDGDHPGPRPGARLRGPAGDYRPQKCVASIHPAAIITAAAGHAHRRPAVLPVREASALFAHLTEKALKWRNHMLIRF